MVECVQANRPNGGFCSRCRVWHVLPWQEAWQGCLELMEVLRSSARYAGMCVEGGGKMLGLALCRDASGRVQRLLAFSGMYNGLWLVDGWVGPIFDLQAFAALHGPVEREIKVLDRKLALLPVSSPERQELRRHRRELSRRNMAAIHDLYQLKNFRGEQRPLREFFLCSGPPSGAGDCCAPKLLHHAQRLGLSPYSMAEFFWGAGKVDAARAGRKHGHRYLPCHAKCQPILGFQLCGL